MKSFSFALALLAVVGVIVQPVAPAFAVTADEPLPTAQLHSSNLPPLIQRELVVGETLDEFILNAQIDRKTREQLADSAQHGEAAILSREQMDCLARTHPALHAKLMNAYTSIPKLTADEKKLLAQLTAENLSAFKAGAPCLTGAADDAQTLKLADAGRIKLASATTKCITGTTGGGNGGTPGAWIVVALMLTLILGVPLFCQIFGNPPICRGWSGP